MASIKGISIKNIKTFRGREYPTNYQGNIYYNGKKMGFWSQDDWGGPDRYDFDTTELNKVAKEYYGEDSIYDLDCLIFEILRLVDYEKIYKKAVKAGYDSVVILSDGYAESYIKVPREKNKDKIVKDCEFYIKDFETKSRYKDKIKKFIFTDLEDFNINVTDTDFGKI
jgi:hypothetical protein